MKKQWGLLVLGLIVVMVLAACGGGSSNESEGDAEEGGNVPVKIGLSTWVGYAPMYVADEKGFFEENGVDMDLVKIEGVGDRRSALAAGEIDGFASTVDTHIVTEASGIPVVQIFAMDDSYGGDGIVSTTDINSIQDLKGKDVAVQTDGGASFFWFMYLLDQEGIETDEINLQNMSAGDAGASFVSGKVDAAVTWEPWLTNAKETDFGQVLMSSDETPGVIADAVAVSKEFADANPEAIEGMVKAWYQAIEFWKENPDEANEIMAQAMGQTVEEFEVSLEGVRFYGEEENKEYFGTKENPGKISELSNLAVEFWYEQGIIDNQPDAEATIGYEYIAE